MWRNWSFRAKLALVVSLPMVMAIALLVAVVRPKFTESEHATSDAHNAELALQAMTVIDELQDESGLSAWALAGGSQEALGQLTAARSRVDAARGDLTAALGTSNNAEDVRAVLEATRTIDRLRGQVDAASVAAVDLFPQYLDRIDTLLGFVIGRTNTATNARLVRSGTAISDFLQAKDQLTRMRGTVTLHLQEGQLSAVDVDAIDVAESRKASHIDAYKRNASAEKLAAIEQAESSAALATSDRLISTARSEAQAGSKPSISPGQWWAGLSIEVAALDVIDDANFTEFTTLANDIASTNRNRAYLYLGAGVLVALLTAAAAYALGRSIVRGLRSVAAQAQHIAGEQLPEVLDTLRNPSSEALAEALPQVAVRSRDEIGVMAGAFNTVLRTSVETALENAQRRATTTTNMLANLGRRNQALIDQQLTLVDALESAQQDPDLLEGLFRIDHLVTRMRRNAENLLVLANQQTARPWTEPVPLHDVLRGAGSEVAAIDRLDIETPAGDSALVAGRYAVDLSHLVAELVENATSYSPPTTRVVVRGERGSRGYRLWVMDRGVGMTDEELSEANATLASPPDIDEMTTDRVGFQVIGRLAQRLDVAVRLQPNPDGGLAATVELPGSLFAETMVSGFPVAVGPEPVVEAPAEIISAEDAPAHDEPQPTYAAVSETDADSMLPALGTAAPRPSTAVIDLRGAPSRNTREPRNPARPPRGRPARNGSTSKNGAHAGEHDRSSAAPAVPPPAAETIDLRAAEPGDVPNQVTPAAMPDTAPPDITNAGLVKRTPGAAFATNQTAVAADQGAFRRLPSPGAADDPDRAIAQRRLKVLSELRAGVGRGRATDEPDALVDTGDTSDTSDTVAGRTERDDPSGNGRPET